MALQLWETLEESMVAYTGLSPATFFTVLALGLTFYYVVSGLFRSSSDHHQRPRDYQEQMQPLPTVQLSEISEDELEQYDGTDPKKPLLMASKGQMHDVSGSRRSYDVFLSFRGTDVRNNFVAHLYAALNHAGINTYIDSEELEKGEQITQALMEAIEESQIAIVVFSENYASSSFCLNEFTKIMERRQQKELIVWPVFYKVEPREVRTPRAIYKKAMDMHKDKSSNDSNKVKRWNEALLDAGSLSGWHFTGGNEAELIQCIKRKISTQVDQMRLEVAKYPVGIDSRVQEVKTILNLRSKDDVFMVGLWGQGGIGKTTLVKAIYGAVCREFQGSCFLECVRENSKSSNDLVALQEKLLSEISLGKEFTVYSVAKGSCRIQDRLHNKKVLIILDDVDDANQLDALVGNCQWFGKGSRIIIATRYKQLLISHGISQDHMYEVKVLKDGEARKLFRHHAFLGNQKIEIHSNLVDGVLCYAGGLPLALVVLGSFLCGRGECEWESTLQKLSKIPDKKINDVLKVSYDGLEDYAKEIFLDIACFFKGQSTEYIKKVLDSCYDFDTTIGVKILIERSLIRGEHGILQMHDLIQSMGMDIVQEKYREDPEKCSRLWLHDDVLNVLSEDMGTEIKAIVLKLPKPEEMHIGPNAFVNMKKLRLLILHNVHNSFQGPIHLPNGLRWFEWPNCASIPEFGNGQKKLIGVDLRNTNIEEVLKQFQDFKKLKFINFSECQSLVCIPDLSCTPHLEELDLSGCNNLERAHKSVASHGKLRLLNLSGCSKLQPLNVLQLKNLQHLILAKCSKLRRFPNGLDKAKCLQKLDLSGTSIEELPVSIGSFVFLEEILLYGCKKLAILPSSIYRLRNLKKLMLGGCSKLIKFPKEERDSSDPYVKTGFPMLTELGLWECNLAEVEFLENPSCFPVLQSLNLEGNKFTNLPTIRQLSNLDDLSVNNCEQLQEILEIPSQLYYLGAYGCKSLSKIPSDLDHVGNICLGLCHELVHHGFTINDLLKLVHRCISYGLEVCLPGGELPEWFIPNNEGHISFMISKGLLEKKFIGLAFCVVLRGNEGQRPALAVEHLVNGKLGFSSCSYYYEVDSYHMMLECFRNCPGRHFLQNDGNRFQLTIRALCGATVKKCGFRLIFKPLENDLEVLLQHNPLLDPALLHMVRDDDSPTSTMEESSNMREELLDGKTSTEENTSSNFVLKGSKLAKFTLEREWMEHEDNQTNTEGNSSNEEEDSWSTEEESNMAEFSIEKYRYSHIHRHLRNVRPGGEMPEEFVPVEDITICFTASQDLYDKIQGLTLCVVFSVEDGQKEVSFDILPHLNGQRRNVLSGTLGSFDSDHVWFQYLNSDVLWGMLEGGVDFGEFGKSYLRFSLSLKVSGGTVKKLGYVIRCMELGNDLKVMLENNQLVDLASLYEDTVRKKKEDRE